MSKINLGDSTMKNFKIFIISLISTFTILFPISIFTTNSLLKNNPNKIISNSNTRYIIPKEQDITILLVIAENLNNNNETKNEYINSFIYRNIYNKKKLRLTENHNNKTKEKYIILKISAHDNTITFANIPKSFKTIAQTNEGVPVKEGTLEQILHSNGINILKNAIENIMKIEINNTIKLDYSGILGIVNNLGGIKIPKNYKTLTTKEYIKMLENNPVKALIILKNSFDKKTKLNNLFASLSNLSYTDLTIQDLENRKKGFEQMIEEQKTKIITPKIEIEKIDDKNKLNEKSKMECKKLL